MNYHHAIEFIVKAKRIDNGEWIEGYYFHNNYFHCKREEMHQNWIIEGAIQEGQVLNVTHCYAIDADTICRCTGFLDREYHFVFENDIIIDIVDGISKEIVVDWESIPSGECLIVGNKFDTQEKKR